MWFKPKTKEKEYRVTSPVLHYGEKWYPVYHVAGGMSFRLIEYFKDKNDAVKFAEELNNAL